MLAEISAGLNSLKSAKDIIQGLNAVRTEAAINEVKINLQGLILEAQQGLFAGQEAQTAAAKRIGELEDTIMRFENWAAEKERYELRAIDKRAFAYMPRLGMERGEPLHWLCATCFESRKRSVLQYRGQERHPGGGRGQYSTWGCNACKGEIVVYYTRKPSERWEEKEEASLAESAPQPTPKVVTRRPRNDGM